MSSYDNITPALCANGCGFYGSPATRNFCSKCYQVVLKEDFALAESYTNCIASSLSKLSLRKENDHEVLPDDDSGAKNKRSRCSCCNKKIRLLGFACRCEGKFCDMHRYPENHMCPFDFKAFGRDILAQKIPFVGHDKSGERI